MFNLKNTVKPNQKRIITPFAGFYQSHYWQDWQDIVSDPYNWDYPEETTNYLDEVIDSRAIENKIAEHYIDWLNEDVLEENFGIKGLLTEPEVHPMNGMNMGDNISALMDTDLLPSLEEIADKVTVVNFLALLMQVAKDRLTSCSGFVSFYSPNIAQEFNKPLSEWNDAHLTCLLDAMVASVAYDTVHGNEDLTEWTQASYQLELEWFYEEVFRTGGGIDGYVWESLTPEQDTHARKLGVTLDD